MAITNKVFYLNSQITEKSLEDDGVVQESIYISGYANVNVPDRVGDVIPSSAWDATGLTNYLKNPVILAYHDHSKPVGRMEDYRVDERGFWIKARISPADEEIYNKVKDGIITAFSVSFRIVEAEYNPASELFIIKKLELVEISVVSVPMQQDSLFSLEKSFDSIEELKTFKMQFAATKSVDSAKELEQHSTGADSDLSKKEVEMTPEQIQELLANAAQTAAKSVLEAQSAAQAEAARKAAEEAEFNNRVAAVVATHIKTVDTGAEKLAADLAARMAAIEEGTKKSFEDLSAALKEKAGELAQMNKSKMQFTPTQNGDVTYEEKADAVILGRILRKDINDTKFGAQLREKVGQHLPSATWELEVSTNMENEIRRRLVVEPIFRKVQMKTNVMTFPLNPETGHANWVTNAQFGTTNSMGGTTASGATGSPHLLKEVTLSAYKIATNEYINFEEEEDSLIVLLPVIRDAMQRRVARGLDKALLLGAGTGSDPVKGISTYDTTSAVTATATGAASIANLRALRKDLGAWGLDPADVTYIVSTDVYYDLLDDTLFQTVDKVSDRATLLTGQVGSIGNSPVLVSAEFPTKASGSASATTNYGAVAVAAGNFIVGSQRGLRFDTQDLVEYQKKVLVASMRTGMTQITTNLGQGVSVFRWS